MAGEFKIAEDCIQTALATAEHEPTMSTDSMARALQASLITAMLKDRSADDIRQHIDFLLENSDSDFMVVTRGC